MSLGERGGDEITSILKKGSHSTAIYTHKLAFLDVCNYLSAGGFSCAKHLRTYGGLACQGGKSFFPYEYIDNLARLRDPLLSYAAFYSSLHGENTLEEGLGRLHGQRNYAQLCQLWVCKGMTSLMDLLIHYNNFDVVPFLTALQEQCHLHKQAEMDILKDGPSLPSIGMRYGMRDAKGLFYTFHPDQVDLVGLLNKAIVGGPSIMFKRNTSPSWTHRHPRAAWLQSRGPPLPCPGWLWCQQPLPLGHGPGHAHRRMPCENWAWLHGRRFALVHGYGSRYSRASLQWLT